MPRYLVEVEFVLTIEAENEDEAERIAENWTPEHPQKQEWPSPMLVTVVYKMKEA